MLLQPPQEKRTQSGGEPAARDALSGFSIFAEGFEGRAEMVLVAEVGVLDEIHNALQIEQPIFERRASESKTMLGFQLFDELSDLRAGIFDELCLVENHGAESEFLQFLKIAAK